MRAYLLALGIAVDQLCNALLGGYPDETLSAYAHRKQDWRRRFLNALFFWQADHCAGAYNSEKQRKHLAPEYRNGDG